jgi:EmrB/QacA subfamily drug resistance transporter
MNSNQANTTANASDQSSGLHGWPLVATIIALFISLLMAAIDGSIVNTATPRIIADLDGFSLYSWLVTIYLLASTTSILIAGKLSDLFGRKWFLVGGVCIFLLGSMLAGTSQSMIELIIFRGVQGLGSGILQTMALVLVADIFPPKERARWLGLFSAVIIIASIVGPLAGGWITDHLGWRWIFYINIPLGACALALTLAWLPSIVSPEIAALTTQEKLRRIDFVGALTITVGTICLLLGLTEGSGVYGWTSPLVLGLFMVTVVMVILFCYVETRVQDPILPFDMFRSQTFSAGAVLSLLLGMVLFGIVVYLPLFLQAVQGKSPTSSGALMTPLTFTIAVLSLVTGNFVAKLGRYQIFAIIGAIVLAVGGFLLTLLTPATTSFELTLTVFLIGIGLGALLPLINVAAQNALPRQRLGVGTSAVTFLRSMGSTVATAVLGTIVNIVSSAEIDNHIPVSAHQFSASFLKAATDKQVLTNVSYRQKIVQQGIAETVRANPVPAGPQHGSAIAALTQQTTVLLNHLFEVVRQAVASGIHDAFVCVFCICLLVLIVTLFLKDIPASQGKKTTSQTQEVQNIVSQN